MGARRPVLNTLQDNPDDPFLSLIPQAFLSPSSAGAALGLSSPRQGGPTVDELQAFGSGLEVGLRGSLNSMEARIDSRGELRTSSLPLPPLEEEQPQPQPDSSGDVHTRPPSLQQGMAAFSQAYLDGLPAEQILDNHRRQPTTSPPSSAPIPAPTPTNSTSGNRQQQSLEDSLDGGLVASKVVSKDDSSVAVSKVPKTVSKDGLSKATASETNVNLRLLAEVHKGMGVDRDRDSSGNRVGSFSTVPDGPPGGMVFGSPIRPSRGMDLLAGRAGRRPDGTSKATNTAALLASGPSSSTSCHLLAATANMMSQVSSTTSLSLLHHNTTHTISPSSSNCPAYGAGGLSAAPNSLSQLGPGGGSGASLATPTTNRQPPTTYQIHHADSSGSDGVMELVADADAFIPTASAAVAAEGPAGEVTASVMSSLGQQARPLDRRPLGQLLLGSAAGGDAGCSDGGIPSLPPPAAAGAAVDDAGSPPPHPAVDDQSIQQRQPEHRPPAASSSSLSGAATGRPSSPTREGTGGGAMVAPFRDQGRLTTPTTPIARTLDPPPPATMDDLGPAPTRTLDRPPTFSSSGLSGRPSTATIAAAAVAAAVAATAAVLSSPPGSKPSSIPSLQTMLPFSAQSHQFTGLDSGDVLLLSQQQNDPLPPNAHPMSYTHHHPKGPQGEPNQVYYHSHQPQGSQSELVQQQHQGGGGSGSGGVWGGSQGELHQHQQHGGGGGGGVWGGSQYGGAQRRGLQGPGPALLDQVEQLLANVDDWGFNAFSLCDASQGHPLSTLCFFLMTRSGLVKEYNMDGWCLARFLSHIEAGYLDNPYHNMTHAAHVLHRMHMLMHHAGFMPHYADQLTLLGCYLAAAIHDYEHLGITNDFLVNTQDPLAILYNDRAPLENHHLAASWALIRQPGYNFLARMPRAEFDRLRKLVIELVLGTDMKLHFSLLSQFNAVHASTRRSKPSQHNKSVEPPSHNPGPLQRSGTTPIAIAPRKPGSLTGSANGGGASGGGGAVFAAAATAARRAPFSETGGTFSQSPETTNTGPASPAGAAFLPPPAPRTLGARLVSRMGSMTLSNLSIRTRRKSQEEDGVEVAPQRSAYSATVRSVSPAHIRAAFASHIPAHLHGSTNSCNQQPTGANHPTTNQPRTSGQHATVNLGHAPDHEAAPESARTSSQHNQPFTPTSPAPANHSNHHSRQTSVSGSGCWTSGPGSGSTQDLVALARNASLGNIPLHSGPLSPLDENERMLSLQIAIKAADICNLCDPHDAHIRWIQMLEEEFFRQGDIERDLGMTISPLFDRNKPGVSKSQVVFMDIVAVPLFTALASAFPGAEPLLQGLMRNYNHWAEEGKRQEEAKGDDTNNKTPQPGSPAHSHRE